MIYKRRISKGKSVRKNRKNTKRRSSKKMRGGACSVTELDAIEQNIVNSRLGTFSAAAKVYGAPKLVNCGIDSDKAISEISDRVPSTKFDPPPPAGPPPASAYAAYGLSSPSAVVAGPPAANLQVHIDAKAQSDAWERERFNSLSPQQQDEERQLNANELMHTQKKGQAGRAFANTGALNDRGRGRGRGRGGGSRRRQRGGGRGHGR